MRLTDEDKVELDGLVHEHFERSGLPDWAWDVLSQDEVFCRNYLNYKEEKEKGEKADKKVLRWWYLRTYALIYACLEGWRPSEGEDIGGWKPPRRRRKTGRYQKPLNRTLKFILAYAQKQGRDFIPVRDTELTAVVLTAKIIAHKLPWRFWIQATNEWNQQHPNNCITTESFYKRCRRALLNLYYTDEPAVWLDIGDFINLRVDGFTFKSKINLPREHTYKDIVDRIVERLRTVEMFSSLLWFVCKHMDSNGKLKHRWSSLWEAWNAQPDIPSEWRYDDWRRMASDFNRVRFDFDDPWDDTFVIISK